jgi:hypothetical protein
LGYEQTQLILAIDERRKIQCGAGGGEVPAVGDRDDVAAFTSGAEEGAIRGSKERFDSLTVAGTPGHAHARRHRDGFAIAVASCAAKRGHCFTQAFGDLERQVRRRVGQQHDELIAAAPPDEVPRPQPALQDLGDCPQDVVSLQAAVCGIYAREVVEVGEQQRDVPIGPTAACQYLCCSTLPRREIGH